MQNNCLAATASRFVKGVMLSIVIFGVALPSWANPMQIEYPRVGESWTVQLPDVPLTLHFEMTNEGVRYSALEESSVHGLLRNRQLADLVRVKRARSTDSTVWAVATLPNAFGGRSQVEVIGNLDRSESRVSALLIPEGEEPVEMDVNLMGAPSLQDSTDKAVVVIVAGTAAVVAIACVVGHIVVDCGERCASACGDQGVDSWSETCGSCTCDCAD